MRLLPAACLAEYLGAAIGRCPPLRYDTRLAANKVQLSSGAVTSVCLSFFMTGGDHSLLDEGARVF